ncbi:putative zinc finger protein [Aphelenchoides besseyi]|nr:putative zinc finger protein [Aphelenchoides besseyi]
MNELLASRIALLNDSFQLDDRVAMASMGSTEMADDLGFDADSEPMNSTDFNFDDYGEMPSTDSHPRTRKSVHQCEHCSKIFVSLKGLQQHAIIHTDEKPFACDICSKSFRFKSNLFEHRSMHANFTPHSCPFCGKTCRLKGNLKKHLKTHVASKEELDEAWRPFASNRRPPAVIPNDAIIIRGGGTSPVFTPPTRTRKKKLGLGKVSEWIDKIKRGDILPQATMNEKLRRITVLIENAEKQSYGMDDFFNQARALAFERFECPSCKTQFMSRLECLEHMEINHPMYREQRPLFCETCLKNFADRKTMELHESYHKRVQQLIDTKDLTLNEPELLLPQACDEDAENGGSLNLQHAARDS